MELNNMAQQLKSVSTGKSDFQAEIEVGVGETSDWYLMPSQVDEIGLELIPAAGDAKVQATFDKVGATAEPPTATGVDWAPGLVSIPTQQILESASAIRLVGGTGSAKLFVKGILL